MPNYQTFAMLLGKEAELLQILNSSILQVLQTQNLKFFNFQASKKVRNTATSVGQAVGMTKVITTNQVSGIVSISCRSTTLLSVCNSTLTG